MFNKERIEALDEDIDSLRSEVSDLKRTVNDLVGALKSQGIRYSIPKRSYDSLIHGAEDIVDFSKTARNLNLLLKKLGYEAKEISTSTALVKLKSK